MSNSRCHRCIHQNSWIQLLQLLLRISTLPQELQEIGFTPNATYKCISREAFLSRAKWEQVTTLLDNKFTEAAQYEQHTIVQLLELWSQSYQNTSKNTFLPLLWALLRRREECPYRICSKLQHQLENLTLLHFFYSREAS